MTTTPHWIKVSGNAYQRGFSQGQQLKERIHKTLTFYQQKIFSSSGLSPDALEKKATEIKGIIEQFNPDYCTEIEAIAKGSEVPAWKIYALNARTEILNTAVSECTSLIFRQPRLMGQTWDWCEPMESLFVLVEHHYPDGNRLLTVTEPGMLAKLGLNSRGVGLCLNILIAKSSTVGVPVHILSRAILESADVKAASAMIDRSGLGKASHFLVADAAGSACSHEFAGAVSAKVPMDDSHYLHTNHCLAPGCQSDLVMSSEQRLATGRQHLRQLNAPSLETMKILLLDDSAGSDSIQCPYHPAALGADPTNIVNVGTCATVLMDLPNRSMQIKTGPNKQAPFTEFSVATSDRSCL